MLKLRTNEDVRAAIRRRGAEIAANMTDQQIFTSPEFSRYATSLADFLLRNHRLYSLDIKYIQSDDAPVAYTDGRNIFLNTGNAIAAYPKLLERRFKTNMGILFHECAHKLFLDFRFNNKAMASISAGTLVGKFPEEPAFADIVAEIKDRVANPAYSGAIANIYNNIDNIICDGHDESAMKRCFPGFIAECITIAGEVQTEKAISLSEMIADDWDAYSIYSSLMLHYAKFGTYKIGDPSPFTDAYLAEMLNAEGIIDTALLIDDYAKRWDCINALMVFLWPVLRKHFPENPQQSNSGNPNSAQGNSNSSSGSQSGQSGANGSSGGSGASQGGQSSAGDQSANEKNNSQQQPDNGSPDSGTDPQQPTLQQILQALADAAQNGANAAPAPVNCNEKAVSVEAIQSNSSTDNGGLSGLMNQLTSQQAETQIQKELDKAQMDSIRNCNMPMIHTAVPTEYRRHIKANKFVYDQIAKETLPIARNLTSQMLALFRELNEEYVQHHKRFGPIIEATESYRLDKAFFAKKKLPDDYPDMAMCLLIDQSGSMGGEKIEYARKTAILMEQFASGIGVPIMIAGHCTHGSECEVTIYTDFTTTDAKKDRYSLGSISPGGANRDGLALRICAELLSKRPERVKLLISVSDGAPNHTHYSGLAARKDISETVKAYRRNGLLIYGAAIDEDKDIIQEIYGKGFLSIQNLSSLPKTLVRLVKQQII